MDYKAPWIGGKTNREILVDAIRGLVVWMSIFVALSLLYWWVTGYVNFGKTNLRLPLDIALVGFLSSSLTRWCRHA